MRVRVTRDCGRRRRHLEPIFNRKEKAWSLYWVEPTEAGYETGALVSRGFKTKREALEAKRIILRGESP